MNSKDVPKLWKRKNNKRKKKWKRRERSTSLGRKEDLKLQGGEKAKEGQIDTNKMQEQTEKVGDLRVQGGEEEKWMRLRWKRCIETMKRKAWQRCVMIPSPFWLI